MRRFQFERNYTQVVSDDLRESVITSLKSSMAIVKTLFILI